MEIPAARHRCARGVICLYIEKDCSSSTEKSMYSPQPRSGTYISIYHPNVFARAHICTIHIYMYIKLREFRESYCKRTVLYICTRSLAGKFREGCAKTRGRGRLNLPQPPPPPLKILHYPYSSSAEECRKRKYEIAEALVYIHMRTYVTRLDCGICSVSMCVCVHVSR